MFALTLAFIRYPCTLLGVYPCSVRLLQAAPSRVTVDPLRIGTEALAVFRALSSHVFSGIVDAGDVTVPAAQPRDAGGPAGGPAGAGTGGLSTPSRDPAAAPLLPGLSETPRPLLRQGSSDLQVACRGVWEL